MSVKKLERQLKVFANDKRLVIVRLLCESGAMNVSEIANEIKLSFRATSRHLLLLERADVLLSQRDSNRVNYELVKPESALTKFVLKALW